MMRRTLILLSGFFGLALCAGPAAAVNVQGTVTFSGQLALDAPAPGIDLDDVRVRVEPTTEATGPGVKCSILSETSDEAGADGLYPDAGVVSAEILMERGGPHQPEGACLVTLRASGWDGISVTAHGMTTLLLTAAEIGANADASPPTIRLRASKAQAELAKDCKKWAKKQLKLRHKCNDKILKLGGAVAVAKCKEAGLEPAACDDGNHVEAILALAHGANDQQTDAANGEGVDAKALTAQLRCQGLFGKAAIKFSGALAARIQSRCVKRGIDSQSCRDAQRQALKDKLGAIDKCSADALADGATGRVVPQVGEPCDACIVAGVVDRKCLKACFEASLAEFASGLVGDVPVCGDGILQAGEFCDDGNLEDGDCCSSLCGIAEPDLDEQSCGVGACEVTVPMCADGETLICEPGSPGEESFLAGDSCSNGVDDDCDGAVDVDDLGCVE